MKKIAVTAILTLLGFCCLASPATAEEGLVKSVVEGCKTEIEQLCKDVTPGRGRILACLYAHNDKLSSRCEFALYDAAIQLERAVSLLGYIANECHEDVNVLCTGVAAGEGRLMDCLEKNEDKVSDRCKSALKEVGLTEKK